MSARDDYYLDPNDHIDPALIANAVAEVKSTHSPSAPTETYSKLQWNQSCQDVLAAYYNQYYSRIKPGSREDLIARPSAVTATSGEVFLLPAGNTFSLPRPSSAYIAIPLELTGQVTVEVVDNSGHGEEIRWEPGTIVYLKGTSGLKCCRQGDEPGAVVCIMLALNRD